MIEKKEKAMTVSDIKQLYYIASIHNIASILRHGILSNAEVHKRGLYRAKYDIANQEIQQQRNRCIESPESHKKKNLHDFVSFFLQPHNAMMVTIQNTTAKSDLCIIQINKKILHDRKSDAVLSDVNSACRESRFFKTHTWMLSPVSTKIVNSRFLSGSEQHLSFPDFHSYKRKRQAEVMFYQAVPAEYITGILVPNETAYQVVKDVLILLQIDLPIKLEPSLFPTPAPGVFSRKRSSLFDDLDDAEKENEEQQANAENPAKRLCTR